METQQPRQVVATTSFGEVYYSDGTKELTELYYKLYPKEHTDECSIIEIIKEEEN